METENIEKRIPSSQNILSHGVDFYLRVKGDSMIEAGILENDLIAVNKKAQIKKGSIVIARINDETGINISENGVNQNLTLQLNDDESIIISVWCVITGHIEMRLPV